MSKEFDQKQFEDLHRHYCERYQAKKAAEYATRSGQCPRIGEYTVDCPPRIEREPLRVQELLQTHLASEDKGQALRIMRSLRYFDQFPGEQETPRPWDGCNDGIQGGTVMDLTAETVDVETFICDVLIHKVVKAEPGEAVVVVKAEGGTDAPARQ
jgi:hypothetical protein